MDKNLAIKNFISENFGLLTSEKFDRRTYKNAQKSFFYDKYKNKYGCPSNKEVLFSLIKFLKAGRVENKKLLFFVEHLPFFKETSINTREDLCKLIEDKNFETVLTKEELDHITKTGVYNIILEKKGREIEEEKRKELKVWEEEIEKKKKEYESLPSVLDSEEISEPEFVPEIEETKPWWQRIYLKDDPFPQADGLSHIKEELYEDVIIKTKPFNNILNALERNPDYLFHTGFLLTGNYGCGKTTFIDYLSYYLVQRHKILPIRITSGLIYSDSSGFTNAFYQKLRKKLSEEVSEGMELTKNLTGEMEIDDQIIELASVVITSSKKKGIIIFLDDYHKHPFYTEQIFAFFGTLQILKDSLTRRDLNVGFMVSGLPFWKDKFQKSSVLSGFLDNTPIEIPEPTTDLVCDVFNKRIKAFCYEGTLRIIKKDFVNKIVSEYREFGLRSYISKIVEELSNRNYAIFDSPIEISENILGEIEEIIMSDPILRVSFNKLLQGSKFKQYSKEQIIKCLELLVNIDMQNNIADNDKLLRDNKYYFKLLVNDYLIQKKKIQDENSFVWDVNKKLKTVFDKILKEYKYQPRDYLIKIFAPREYTEKLDVVESGTGTELARLKFVLENESLELPKTVKDNIDSGIRQYEAFLLADHEKPDLRYLERLLERVEQSFNHFSRAIFEIDESHLYFRKLEINDVDKQWRVHPKKRESFERAFRRILKCQTEKGSREIFALAMQETEESIKDIIVILENSINNLKKESHLLYRPRYHTDDEIELFNQIEENKNSPEGKRHYGYMKRLSEFLEVKLRNFFYFTSILIFGEDKYFEQFPQTVKKYAYKNIGAFSTQTLEKNKFDGLTRSQFKQIFLEGNQMNNQIIKGMSLDWTTSDWNMFCNRFAEDSIKTGHQHIDTFTPADRSKYQYHCKMVEELTCAMNELVSKYFQNHVFIRMLSEKMLDPTSCLFRSSFIKLRIGKDEDPGKRVFLYDDWPENFRRSSEKDLIIKEFEPKKEDFERLKKAIKSNIENDPLGIVTLDLLDVDYIISYYQTNLPNFIYSLAFCKYITKEFVIEPWFGSSIAIKKGTHEE